MNTWSEFLWNIINVTSEPKSMRFCQNKLTQMIDPTDRRYHILKDTSTKYKYFKPSSLMTKRAEKSYQISGNKVWEQWSQVKRIWFSLHNASTGALYDLGQVPPPPLTTFLPITMWNFIKYFMFFRWKIQSAPLKWKIWGFSLRRGGKTH